MSTDQFFRDPLHINKGAGDSPLVRQDGCILK